MRAVASICLLGLALELWTAQARHGSATVRFEAPSVVSSVDAVYPLHSVASGTVVLELTLNETGEIIGVRVVHGIPSLTEPAELSARKWKFSPAEFDGKPVPSKIAVAFSFVPPNVGPRS